MLYIARDRHAGPTRGILLLFIIHLFIYCLVGDVRQRGRERVDNDEEQASRACDEEADSRMMIEAFSDNSWPAAS